MPAEVLTARTTTTTARRIDLHLDVQAVSAWVLSLALVLYLGIDGGGYSLSSHGQVGIVVWWIVVLCAAWGLLPAAQLSTGAKTALGLLCAFTLWNLIAISWSISTGRSFQDLALVSCYFGIAVLGVAIHRERGPAVKHTSAAVATAIVVLAALALASRLWPHLFAGSQQTGQFLGAGQSRLAWPLNYWNALATLMAIGAPLLLAHATTARTLAMQSLAAAGIPVLALTAAFTQSRGGILEGAVALVAFLAFAHDRSAKLATTLAVGAGSAILIYAGLHRHALQQGLTGGDQPHQAHQLLAAIIVVCLGVALVQAGIGLVARHATRPKLLQISPKRAWLLTGAGVVVLIVVALAAGAPHHLHHAWDDFKNPDNTAASTASHFSATSGEGRYQYWVAAVDSAKSHPFTGSGPGTFQLDWLPRAPFDNYVTNAHNLYVETYAELGLIGLTLLAGFLLTALGLAIRASLTSRFEQRTRAAAVIAALLAFMVAAAYDWVWQMPVLVAAVLLLVSATLAPTEYASTDEASAPTADESTTKRHRAPQPLLISQILAAVTGLACLVAIAYPLATGAAISASQSAVQTGNSTQALADAQSAVRLESGSADAQLQLALVQESLGQLPAALASAQHAVANEPRYWAAWLVLSRLRAKSHDARGAIAAYERAKSLNPHSPLFTES